MKSSKDFTIPYIKIAILLTLINSIILYIIFRDKSLILGHLVGTSVSILFFRLIYENAKKVLDKGYKGAKISTRINYFIRYIFYGIILLVSYKNPNTNFYTTALGLFMIKFSIIIKSFFDALKNKGTDNLK